MNLLIWSDGDQHHVALTPAEALEIASALLQAAKDYPNCEYEVRFTVEDGEIRWFVKAHQPRHDS